MQSKKRKNYLPVDASAEEKLVEEIRHELNLSRYEDEDIKADKIFTETLRRLSEADRLQIFLFCAKRGRID